MEPKPPEGFEESEATDDELFPPITNDEWNELPRRTKKRARHVIPEFVCSFCSHAKSGGRREVCVECRGHLDRLIKIYHEAVTLYPNVRGMKLSEFFEKLWEKEKRRERTR